MDHAYLLYTLDSNALQAYLALLYFEDTERFTHSFVAALCHARLSVAVSQKHLLLGVSVLRFDSSRNI